MARMWGLGVGGLNKEGVTGMPMGPLPQGHGTPGMPAHGTWWGWCGDCWMGGVDERRLICRRA
jgi:hypothetical protein